MKFSFAFVGLFFSISIAAQKVDYNEISKQLNMSCANPQLIDYEKNLHLLDSLINMNVLEKDHLLYDYGMNYYIKFMNTRDTSNIPKAIEKYKQCWIEYESTNCLYNLMFNYWILKDCDSFWKYNNQYELYPIDSLKYHLDEIEKLKEKCN